MKKLIFAIFFIIILNESFAQTSVSFHHLGNTTFQNSYLNPALVPQGKYFIGLPAISGIHLNFNNKVSYNEAITKEANRTLIDVDKIIPNLQDQNMVSAQVNVNLLHFGYRLKSGTVLSLTANERIEADLLYPKQLVEYAWVSAEQFTNQDVALNRAGIRMTHFREYGLGVSHPINEALSVGARAKFLVGFFDMSTAHNFKGTLNSSGEAFQLEGRFENATLRSSGRGIYEGETGDLGSHLLMNSNTGAALDLGMNYRLSKYYSFSLSVLDLGFINWKEDIKNRTVSDTTFSYAGVDLNSVSNLRNIIEDTLINRLEPRTNFEAYRGWLPGRAYFSWIHHYSPTTDIYSTVGARMIQREFKMLYGLGVTKRFNKVFTGSVSATKLPQQFFNVGAALAVKGGPVQFYMAADQVVNFSVPDAKALDFRIGINFIFKGKDGDERSGGYNKPITRAKGLDTNEFLGKGVKTKKREGIYSIISKQSRRELKRTKTKRAQKVTRKSLNGRSGKKNE